MKEQDKIRFRFFFNFQKKKCNKKKIPVKIDLILQLKTIIKKKKTTFCYCV